MFTEDEKARELAGKDEKPYSEEVQVARDELKVLHDEKHKTQRVITTVQKELETAQNKTRKLAEVRFWFLMLCFLFFLLVRKCHN